jgi:hypothetical protein
MKVWLVLTLFALIAGCAPSGLPFLATPKPTLTAIDVYLNETDGVSESLATGNRVVREQLNAQQTDPSLLANQPWRDTLTKNLRQIRLDYQTLSQAWAPPGSEQYHQALTAAESHSDKAAELLLAWLDDKDEAKYEQAVKELKAEEAGLAQAQQLLESLQKK